MFSTIAALCAGLALSVVSGSGKSDEKPALFQHESGVLQKTNAERARYGLPPLVLDKSLLNSARQHAAWMTRSQTLQHTGQAVGENIAMGQNSSGEVVRDWMNSPGHRANILNPGYTRIGVAGYTAANGQVFWCQQFLR